MEIVKFSEEQRLKIQSSRLEDARSLQKPVQEWLKKEEIGRWSWTLGVLGEPGEPG